MNGARKFIKFCCFIVGSVSLFAFHHMNEVEMHYTRHMPALAQPQDGRTVALEVFYCKTVYVTAQEAQRLKRLHWTSVICTVGFVGLGLVVAPHWRRSENTAH